MVALHYFKYLHNLSDEQVVNRWVENPAEFCEGGQALGVPAQSLCTRAQDEAREEV
jgi:hypothetical protein